MFEILSRILKVILNCKGIKNICVQSKIIEFEFSPQKENITQKYFLNNFESFVSLCKARLDLRGDEGQSHSFPSEMQFSSGKTLLYLLTSRVYTRATQLRPMNFSEEMKQRCDIIMRNSLISVVNISIIIPRKTCHKPHQTYYQRCFAYDKPFEAFSRQKTTFFMP